MNSNTMLNKGHTHEPNTIQKAIDQIGLDAVMGVVNPIGHLNFCDMHGHYATQGTQINTDDGIPPIEECPLCIGHDPSAEGTTATDVELYINLKDAIESATTIL